MDRKSTEFKDINNMEIFVGDTVTFGSEDDDDESYIEEHGIVQEDMLDDYYVVTDDGFAFRLDEDLIEFYNVEKK